MQHPSASSTQHRRPRARGFTLIEILIAVIIVGVLAAVALPTFLDSIRKSRRSEAFAALATMQQAQERLRSSRSAYSTTLSDLGITSSTTASGYYTLSVEGPTATPADLARGYVVSAAGNAGTSQANDTQCRKLSARVFEGKVQYAGCGSCSTFTYADSDPCWAR